jgi:hypothetical protein
MRFCFLALLLSVPVLGVSQSAKPGVPLPPTENQQQTTCSLMSHQTALQCLQPHIDSHGLGLMQIPSWKKDQPHIDLQDFLSQTLPDSWQSQQHLLFAQNAPTVASPFSSTEIPKATFEPIPTQWPNARIEQIPTSWPQFTVTLVNGGQHTSDGKLSPAK